MARIFRGLLNLFRRAPQKADSATQKAAEKEAEKITETPSADPAKPDSNSPTSPSFTRSPRHRSPLPDPFMPSEPLPPKDVQLKNLKQVLNVLRAYVLTFGRPESDLELRAVIGAIVANLPAVQITNRQLEGFMDETIAAFESLGLESTFVDVTAQLLAEQVSVWLLEQQATVSNVMSAYLQQFAPDNATWRAVEILSLAQTVVATLNDGSLSRSGGRVLVEKVAKTFNLEQALSQWVAPEWVALAQRVASYTNTGDLQLEVRSIAWAYIQRFQAILSPQLIDQIIKTGPLNLSPAEVLAGNFDDFSQMLYYKFQLLESDPVVTKSHEAIAANVRKAIADLQARREAGLDVTKGVQTGDLEVSSPFGRLRTRRQKG